MADTTGRILVT